MEFWHLTFQEHLAARAIAGLTDARSRNCCSADRQTVPARVARSGAAVRGLLASKQGLDKVDALFSAVLDRRGRNWRSGAVRGPLGAMHADLRPLGYKPQDGRYQELMDAALAVFDREKAAGVR